MTEKEKMLLGYPYKSYSDTLFKERQVAKNLLFESNSIHPNDLEIRNVII